MQSMWVQLVCFKQQWIGGIFPVLPVSHMAIDCIFAVLMSLSVFILLSKVQNGHLQQHRLCACSVFTHVILYRDFFLLHMKPKIAHSPRSFILEKMLIPVGSSWA